KRSSRIIAGFGIDLDTAEIPSPTNGMLAAVEDHEIGKGNCLVASQQRISILNAPEACERKVRDTEVKRVLRNARNPGFTGNILGECVQIRRRDPVAVVVDSKDVCELAKRTDIAHGNVVAPR